MKSLNQRLALFKQTIICDTRDLSLVFLKTLTVLAFLIGYITINNSYGSAKGYAALEMLFSINIILLPAAAITLFLPIIMDERRNQTIGLIMMTGIDPFGYITGKCGSRLAQLLMLISLQIPYAILCIAMGGIGQEMVFKVYGFLFAYTFAISSLCIFCSLYFSQFLKGLIFAGLIFLCLLMFIFLGSVGYFRDLLFTLASSIAAIYDVGFHGITQNWVGVQDYYLIYCASFLAFGCAVMALTLLNFTKKAMNLKEVNVSDKSNKIIESILPKRLVRKERFSSKNPIFTKDYYYILHGRSLTLLQVAVIFGMMFYISLGGHSFRHTMEMGMVTSYFTLLTLVWYAGNRIWYEEIDAMTFNSLKLTSANLGDLFMNKNKAVLRTLIPSIICLLTIGLTFFYSISHHGSSGGSKIFLISFFFLTAIPAAYFGSILISLYAKKMRFLVSVCAGILILIIEVSFLSASMGVIFLGIGHLCLSLTCNYLIKRKIHEQYID